MHCKTAFAPWRGIRSQVRASLRRTCGLTDEVEQKRRRLAVSRGMSTRTALVYDGHLAPSVEAEGYFDAIIPYRQLLGL